MSSEFKTRESKFESVSSITSFGSPWNIRKDKPGLFSGYIMMLNGGYLSSLFSILHCICAEMIE
jgi:hypothetical protein